MKQETFITLRRAIWTIGLVAVMIGDALDFDPLLVRAAGAATLFVFLLDVVLDPPPDDDLDQKE